MILNVRGSLGTQVMEYLVGLAQLQMTGHELKEIHINTKDTADHSKVDYLSQIFDLGVPVQFVDDTKKVGCFKKENLEILIKYFSDVKKEALWRMKRDFLFRSSHLLFHYRNGDRKCLPDSFYRQLWSIYSHDFQDDALFIGNDHQRIEELYYPMYKNNLLKSNSPFADWYSCMYSDLVIGGFSMFTISAAVLGRNRTKIYINKDNPVVSESDIISLRYLSDSFNITTIEVNENEI